MNEQKEENLITDDQAQQMIKRAINRATHALVEKIVAQAMNKQS